MKRRRTPEQTIAKLQEAGPAFAASCSAKSTIFCADIAAGVTVAQFAEFLRRLPADPDTQINVLSNELAVSSASQAPVSSLFIAAAFWPRFPP